MRVHHPELDAEGRDEIHISLDRLDTPPHVGTTFNTSGFCNTFEQTTIQFLDHVIHSPLSRLAIYDTRYDLQRFHELLCSTFISL